MLTSSPGLGGGPDEDLVERHAARPGDGEGDDLRDVVGGDCRGRVELLDSPLGLTVGDVIRELGRDGAGLDDDHAHVGLEFLAQGFDQPLRPHLVAA